MQLYFTAEPDTNQQQYTVPIGQVVVAGRSKKAQLRIRHASLSKAHCELRLVSGGGLQVRDLGSRNGTWVNGEAAGEEWRPVSPGDELVIGQVEVGVGGPPGAPRLQPQQAPKQAEAAPPEPTMLAGSIQQPDLPPVRFSLSPDNSHLVGTEADCSIMLIAADGISSKHARLEQVFGTWFVEDMGSKNGTFLNKEKVTRSPLKPGDAIMVGAVKLALDHAQQLPSEAANPSKSAGAARVEAAGEALRKVKPWQIGAAFGVGLSLIIGLAVLMKPGVRKPPPPAAAAGKAKDLSELITAIAEGVKYMKNKDFPSADTMFETANEIRTFEAVTMLRRLAALLRDEPTEHINEIVDLTEKIGSLKHDLWRKKTGVTAYAHHLNGVWSEELRNHAHAKAGDALFDAKRWKEALDRYQRIGANSEFRQARAKRLLVCARRIAEELIAEAEKAMDEIRPAEAEVMLDRALKLAPADLTDAIYKLRRQVKANMAHGKLIQQGQDLFKNGNLVEAIQALELVPETSEYYERAAALVHKARLTLIAQQARALFKGGKGEQALALLKGAPDGELGTLRDKIKRVLEVVTVANQKFNAKDFEEANAHWALVRELVADEENAYHKMAIERGNRRDPKLLAERAVTRARRVTSTRFEDRLRSAMYLRKALALDPENADANKMRAAVERELNLKWAVAAQRYRESKDADTLISIAKEIYRIKRALRPSGDEMTEKVAAMLKEAGGELPPPDKLPADDDD